MLWKCCTQYASNVKISAVASGLEKFSFHSNHKERQCQRMFKLLHSWHISHTSSGLRTGKVSFHSNPKEGQSQRMLKLLHNWHISHTSKVMLSILQPDFHSMWTVNFQMFKLYLEKAKQPEIKLPTSAGSSKKHENSRKTTTFALLTIPKPLIV